MRNTIPERLQTLIDQSRYAGDLRNAFERFLPILGNSNSGLFFFPEYTDHGPDHIRGVLTTAGALLPEKAWALLTPEDGVVIAVATLLHDAAMVLTADGLIRLVTTENSTLVSKLDSRRWPDLFDEFYGQARRWDGQTLFRILGDQSAASSTEDLAKDIVHIRDRLNPEKWSIRYRKFLGEFVRRHHARLAHEIARFGFPGHQSPGQIGLTGLPDEIADISGFIARSHNVTLRSTYDYLDTEYDGHVICRGTHPLILMVLLRIADYLQLDATRVNTGWLSIQRLRSPISQDEWNAHLAVKEVRPDDNDPESLFISAKPENASTFVKLRKTITGLQAELDTSWAVLSEVYGRRTELCDLGITVRRVRSNLDDEKQFLAKQSPSYFPLQASFDTSGASLLKLLIRPLYGDRPDVGVRELLQNALDAVRELRRLRENHPELAAVPTLNQTADILISIDKEEDGYHYLTVADKGIGMTAETVRNYFLKAGASFRQSDAWRKEFTRGDKSTVLRSGRFGIGALAAFLLGDRLHVHTRHVWSNPQDGVEFNAGLDDEFIELQRTTLSFVGTTVTIRLDRSSETKLKEAADSPFWDWDDEFPWDWYVLDDPVVERRLKGKKLPQAAVLPSNLWRGPWKGWHPIQHPDYRCIHWSFNQDDESTKLVCNGIRVVTKSDVTEDFEYSWGPDARQTPFEMPAVSVFDEDARLPLTLHRDRLETPHFPFEAQLAEDVTKDLCAMLLLHSPSSLPGSENPKIRYKFGKDNDWSPFPAGALLWTSTGTTMLHPWHIKRANLTRVVCSTSWLGELKYYKDMMSSVSGYGLLNDDPASILETFAMSSRSDNFRRPKHTKHASHLRMLVMEPQKLFRHRSVLGWDEIRQILSAGASFRSFGGLDGEAYLLERGELSADDGMIRTIWRELKRRHAEPGIVVELSIDPKKIVASLSPFSRVWSNIMKRAEIPYDLAARQLAFGKAYDILNEHIEAWRHPLKDDWRQELLGRTRHTRPQH